MTADYRDLVEYVVKNIVDNPDAVVVESQVRHRTESVEIRLDPGDVGRVIGKGGRNIEAIRSLVKAAATKDHRRVNVEVISDRVAVADGADGAEPGEDVEAEDVEGEDVEGEDIEAEDVEAGDAVEGADEEP